MVAHISRERGALMAEQFTKRSVNAVVKRPRLDVLSVAAVAVSASQPARSWSRGAAAEIDSATAWRSAGAALLAACAVCAAAFSRGAAPNLAGLAAAMVIFAGFGVQWRLIEAWRNPNARGARNAGIGAALAQIAAAFSLHPPLLGLLAILGLWVVACGAAPTRFPSARLAMRAALAPLAILLACACDWLAAAEWGAAAQRTAWPALALLAFANGVCFELARSARGARDAETRGDVYAEAWGASGAAYVGAVATAMALASACACAAAGDIGWSAAGVLLITVFPSISAFTTYAQWPTAWRARGLHRAVVGWAFASSCIVGFGPYLAQALE